MKITVFLNGLGLGGSEKAACRWSRALRERGHAVDVLSLADGPRRVELEKMGLAVGICSPDVNAVRDRLRKLRPDVIHAHVPGHPHIGDVLGGALALLPKIPMVSTNIFGRFDNPRENQWTDFRLFISWTSCVQAARRSFQRLDNDFFRHASVASYPLDPDDGPNQEEILQFRRNHGIDEAEVLFGRISRPEPNKWTDLPLVAFRRAAKQFSKIKLLLREPPPEVARRIQRASDSERFLILPATADPFELRLTMASLDVVLHASIIGESFGYGIAEPMNYAKPVIANSTPWQDQAQIELVRHGETGFIASTAATMAAAVLRLANNRELRVQLGDRGRMHIRELANPEESISRVENALQAAIAGGGNPLAREDMSKARVAAQYLDDQQFGHRWREQMALRPTYYRVRFHEFRKAWRTP